MESGARLQGGFMSEPVRHILLVQDDPAIIKIVHEAMAQSKRGNFQVDCVHLCADAEAQLIEYKKLNPTGISAVVVDLMLSDCQGIEVFNRLFAAAPLLPFLILCDTQHEALAQRALEHGAVDYLMKNRLDSYLLTKVLGSMIERTESADALFEQLERARVTLNSIGDGVLSTDVAGRVTFLNAVAEALTGWSYESAKGQAIDEVFKIIDATTRAPAGGPMELAIHQNKTVGLTPNCLLIRRNGYEAAIEDSAAPIHDRYGNVTGAVMVFRDVSATRALSDKMSYLAQHDSLTDLPNRLLLNDRLTQAVAWAYRHRKKSAVLYLDIDRFKHINDSLGHAIGDRLLQSIARRLLACVRASDTVSRQGGDEFVILLSEVEHAKDAALIAEKIIVSLSAHHCIDEHELHVTASIGIVVCPDDGSDVETLLKNADFAMYHAKDSGRNNYQFFKSEMNASAIERQLLESDLRRAIVMQEFMLYYQPKLNLETGTITGAEALIRWRHPFRGLVLPAQFISIAEDSGLIVPIGRWVLREACRQAQAWQDAGLAPIRIAVNISPVELRARDFVESVRAILAGTGLDPRYLELELTETVLLEDSTATDVILKEIKDMGVRLALDDFGTGYSSLSYLRRFPIDTLKIDQSFVRNLGTDTADAGIVSTVINMGKSLQLQVVAEGVETLEQLDFLKGENCWEGQGYYFSRPIKSGAFAELLGESPRGIAADVMG